MPYENTPQPMLHWTPFGGDVREYRLDPMHRPTFNHVAMVTPPNHAIKKKSLSQKRRRRRPSPLQSKKQSPGRYPTTNKNDGGNGNLSRSSVEIDFTADCQ